MPPSGSFFGGPFKRVGDTVVSSMPISAPNLDQMSLYQTQGFRGMRRVSVRLDGYGDFTDIQSAINGITDASPGNQYVVDVYDDISATSVTDLCYQDDASQKLAPTTTIAKFCALVFTKNWVHIRGIGSMRKVSVIMPTTLSASSYQHIQTFFFAGNCIIQNIHALIQGGRYAGHQDSGRSLLSLDRYATTIYDNMDFEHLGNGTELGYPAGAWSAISAMANGTAPGQKQIFKKVRWISNYNVPFYFHSNVGFDAPSEHVFEDCSIHKRGTAATPATVAPNYADLGSGQRAKITLLRCNFSRLTVSNDIYSDEQALTLANEIKNGGADIVGSGNAPMACAEEYYDCLVLRCTNNNESITVTGGTAYNDIYGGDALRYPGAPNMPGRVWGKIRIIDPNPSRGASRIFSLAYRLGNCAATPKTLTVNVAGTAYTITFNRNYMTADGSPYSWDTVPAVSQAAILADISAVAPAAFTALGRTIVKLTAPSDCTLIGTNVSANAIALGLGVVRDSSGWDCWRVAAAGEFAQGIALERINPGAVGAIGVINKSFFPCYAIGLGATVTPGAMYKITTGGGFVTTTVPSEADLIAVDTVYLRGFQK